MGTLIYRQLRLDPLRTALTSLALAAVVALILVLEGFYAGLIAQLGRSVTERGGDLIVTQAGVSNLTATRSVLPQYARLEAEAIPGIRAAHPFTALPLIYAEGERRTPILFMVYDSAGGPRELIAGGQPEAPREIVIDRSLARKYNLDVGAALVISGFEFRIAGVASGAAAFFTPFGFARYDDLIDFYFESDVAADISTFPLLSFLLVELVPGADRTEVAAMLEASIPVGDVFTPEALAAEDEKLGKILFGTVFELLIAVGYVIGVLVTAILSFASVNSRCRSFGVLKALGFSGTFLSRAVVLEAILVALVAIPLGVVIAGGIGAVIEAVMPLYLVLSSEPVPVARTAAATLVFTVIGAVLPVRLILRLDPAEAFRR